MFTRYLIALAFLAGCCPVVSGPPGDAGATSWKKEAPPEKFQVVIDCQGTSRGPLNITTSDTLVKNCTIEGDIRIWKVARNANSPKLLTQSRQTNYVSWIRNQAPSHIRIENSIIKGKKIIPLYVGPGVSFTTVKNVKIIGESVSTMVYLGAESHHTVIQDSVINATQSNREAIAIDASDHNVITGNKIIHQEGGVFLYRNCGEAGIIRHTTPSHNNTFQGAGTAIYLSSRDGDRCYCDKDQGYALGSSLSDLDHARFNTIRNNELGKGLIESGKSAQHNIITDNK